jgi:hypothetical protein
MTTNVPPPTFGPLGFIAPAESTILTGVTTDINTAFGGNLNPALNTPQGQLASSIAAIVGNVNDLFLFYTSQTDPKYAVGRMQDGIARIYFIERNPSLPTVVQGVCTGLSGTTIPVGALTADVNGNIYQCTGAGTISLAGNVTLSFANVLPGPVPCPAGEMNIIYQTIPGWDAVINPADGAVGVDVESAAQFETRRSASVAQNSLGSLPSILGAVLNVPGVIDAYVTENNQSTNQTIGGVTLKANSVYVAVLGGASQAVAQAIWSRKAPGCAYNGTTTVTVLDTSTGYTPPYPSYQVSFQIPAALNIVVAVNIVNSVTVPSNAVTLIQNAIIGAFAGVDQGPPAQIGTTMYASRFYAPVAALGTWAQIVDILLGSSNVPAATITGSIAGTVLTVTAVSGGIISTGETLFDTTGNLLAGTMISSFGSGSGLLGTYNVSQSQSVASEAMTCVMPSLFSVTPFINQIPAAAAPNIIVTLI